MTKKRTPIVPDRPYHLGARCINREWFRVPIDEAWSIFGDYLYLMKCGFGVEIHSFVLMSNHFHLIATFPEGNLGHAMNYFMRETSRVISRSSGRINQVYGGPHHKSLLESYRYFLHAYKYVYRNPVEAQLCEMVEEYPYSTLSGLLGLNRIVIPVTEDLLLFDPSVESALRWLNQSYKKGHRDAIRTALSHSTFSLPFDDHGLKHPLEGEDS